MNGYYIWYQLKITTQALPEWFQNTKKKKKNENQVLNTITRQLLGKNYLVYSCPLLVLTITLHILQ